MPLQSAHIPLMNALMAALQADMTLQGLLAGDPKNVGRYAIYMARYNDVAAPVYPCITFRTSMAAPIKHFEDAAPVSPTAPIDQFRVDFEIWANQPSSAIVQVLDELQALFRNQQFSLTGGGVLIANANMFRGSLLTYQPDLYDSIFQKWFGIASYQFRVQR
jgi:hypothetical protein